LQKKVQKLTVFQRTPHWLFPSENYRYSEQDKQRFRDKPERIWRTRRTNEFFLQQFITKAVTGQKLPNFIFSNLCKAYLRFSVGDPELRKKLTPDYRVGCKRIIISNQYYPALQKENVELHTDGIREITPKGVIDNNGVEHEFDVLVLATGFNPVSYMRPMDMRGENGQTIDEAWEKKIATYRSMFMPGFPNNFLMLGPNTPIGNYSVIAMSEVQCGYILKLMERWRKGEFDAIDAKPEAAQSFVARMKDGLKNTVWVGGCSSWYLDGDGDPILWPYTWKQWEEEMEEPNLADFNTSQCEPEPLSKTA
ncbi:MAG: NAD(P)/FAD-dependent oxidoreductase, partial [Cellvibrionaceae bacterium]|nr:NAD(P)/FAD-dependent oxidoreductase [Cellvibrionaceae bacterium]